MAGTIPERRPLGASTTNRKWWIDVEDPVTPAGPVGVFGIAELKPKFSEATQQDDSDFDGEGYKSSVVTALAHGVEGKLHRKTLASDPTQYDPGQEILRLCSLKMGALNRLKYRIYEMEVGGPRVEAYEGYGLVTWTPDGGGMDATDSVSFNIVGQGKLAPIEHPEGGTPAVYVVSILPEGAAATETVAIRGSGFNTSTTAAGYVKFGATNATQYEVLDSGLLIATVPAGAAGPVVVEVGGTTANYTRA